MFQPEGSLKIAGLDLPFLIIQVADTESYKHARTTSGRFLMGSKGKTCFVILIDLMRKTAKDMKDSEPNGLESRGQGSFYPLSRSRRVINGLPPDSNNWPEINKRTRTASPAPAPLSTSPPSPTLPPLLPVSTHSHTTVTVLTTCIMDHPEVERA